MLPKLRRPKVKGYLAKIDKKQNSTLEKYIY